MSFADEKALFEQEMDNYYGALNTDVSQMEDNLHAESSRHPEWLPYQRKAFGYRWIAERCPIHIFRHCPFYFEIDTGRHRTDLGTGGLGGWLKREAFGAELAASSRKWLRPFRESGLSSSWEVLDDNHHTLGYDSVFRYGLKGLMRRAEERLLTASTGKERGFLRSVISGNQSLIDVSLRFAREAERMLANESNPEIARRLERISVVAMRVPADPPATFYEALNTIIFLFHVVQAIEGNGISVFGRPDRILLPYYRRDIENGDITREEAKDLIGVFLAVSDARFGMETAHSRHVGTNSTVTIGGCDSNGALVFNEITEMVLEAHRELHLVDPKINARISSGHPPKYFQVLAEFINSGGNSLALFNDDVVIAANTAMGKDERDCRLYVGGGCQENVLENTEVNSRATMYLNLMHVFLLGFFPAKWEFLAEVSDWPPRTYDTCDTFEEFYEAFLRNLESVVVAHIDERNRTEREGWRYNPCPLHSSTLDDCIEKGLDMMEGGARYSYGSVSLTGVGTLIDSLFAVREAVYDRALVSLSKMKRMLAQDFSGEEAFRLLLVNRIPKYGHDDESIRSFSSRVFADLARITSGMPNSRGGRYEASLFSFRSFVGFGEKTGATPDGRKASEYLSPGMSPSLQSLGPKCNLSQLLSALEPLDLSLYPVVAVLDAKLPAKRGGHDSKSVISVIKRFLTAGGSVLQINCIDPEILAEAREHPELHRDLVVRVSGYSSYFHLLTEQIQDEIIARTETAI